MPTLPDRIDHFMRWLDAALAERQINDAELARRGGFHKSVISKIRAGSLPGWDACVGIARGLNLPPELVFREAGHLPALPESERLKLELDHLYQMATTNQRREVLQYLRYLIEFEK